MKGVSDSLAAENFYAAAIRDVKFGPRRELTLNIETYPKFKQGSREIRKLTVHFGAISNYEEVKQFFARTSFESLHHLRETKQSGSDCTFELEFDRTEEKISIVAGKVAVNILESA